MQAHQSNATQAGWTEGWMVLKVKQALPGDFVSMHAHAEQAQAEAQQRGSGYQVFHGRRHAETGELVVD